MTLPLFFWLLLQVAAISLSAAQIELSANFPRPAESTALHLLICVQMFFAALLSPLLFTNWKSATSVITSSIVFVFLAGFLSFQSLPVMALVSAYLVIWLAAIALSSIRLGFSRDTGVSPAFFQLETRRRDASATITSLTLTMITTLGGLLWYLRSEFVAATDYRTFAPFNPILGVFSQIDAERFLVRMWILPLAMACLAALSHRLQHPSLRK
jgi:hypothetical protein